MVRYFGVRLESGCKVWRIGEDGKIRALLPSRRNPNFPTDAWEWGYGGAGPHNLAWSLCYDASQDIELTTMCSQGVKWQVVAMLSPNHWMLTDQQIREAMDRVGQSYLSAEHEEPPNVDKPATDHTTVDEQYIDLGLDNKP